MYPPSRDDESTGLRNYLDQQLEALRASVYGLTEQQARSRACRSALSVGGLVKHVARGMREATAMLRGGSRAPELTPEGFAEYMGSFTVGDGESMADVLAGFDAARAEFLEVVQHTDPDADMTAPPAPWDGILDARPMKARYYLGHQLEEFARHAGHADILREQIDATAVPTLVMTLAGAPANDFFTPFVAAPGTIGAP